MKKKKKILLEDMCKGRFAKELVENNYCLYKATQEVGCKYREKKTDLNSLYLCNYKAENDKRMN